MKLYDITQEVFCGKVYPGDPVPSFERILNIAEGDPCNLTTIQMCAHNATHIDAPYHFYDEKKTVEQLDLTKCIGPCTVIETTGLSLETLEKILANSQKRIILKGSSPVTLQMAKLFNDYEILLVGVESQSVGPVDDPMPVHLELLHNEVILLEGLVLDEVMQGEYFLFAAPIKLGGCDGAPCRAILLKADESNTCNNVY